jgi:hypothetical protein
MMCWSSSHDTSVVYTSGLIGSNILTKRREMRLKLEDFWTVHPRMRRSMGRGRRSSE